MLDPIIAGDNEIDHIFKMIEVLGTLPNIWSEGHEQLKNLGMFFPHKEKSDLKKFLVHANPSAIDLLERMFEYIPERRITAKEILKHPYFKQIREQSPLKPHIPDRGKSLDPHNQLKIKNNYIVTSINDLHNRSYYNNSPQSKFHWILHSGNTSKFSKNNSLAPKNFTIDIKPFNHQVIGLKTTPAHNQFNPLKMNMTPVLRHKDEIYKPLPPKVIRHEAIIHRNSYLAPNNIPSYFN